MTKARDIANAGTALSSVDATELGYVNGVTSAIQTQLDAKTAKSTLTTTGDIYYASSANTPARLAIGSTSQVLTVSGGVPTWAALPASDPTFVGCFIYGSGLSAISVPNNTGTVIDLPDELYDTHGFHSTTVNPSRITVPTGQAGYYYLSGKLAYEPGSQVKLSVLLKISGSGVSAVASDGAGGDFNSDVATSGVFYLNVGDYVEIQARQITGGSQNVKRGNETETFLMIAKLGV